MTDYDGDNKGELSFKLFRSLLLWKAKDKGMILKLNYHWICINGNERASFVHGLVNYYMRVKYRLSAIYYQKKEISLKTYNGGILINKG